MRSGAIKVIDEFGNLTPEGKELYDKGQLDPATTKIINDAKASKTIRTVLIVIGLLLAAFLIYWFLIRK
jgi:hypothetical protein